MSTTPKDGGPAFPPTGWGNNGMSLRDYFAGQALAGCLASQTRESHWAFEALENEGEKSPHALAGIARLCYDLADAMLAEREKPTQAH